MAEETACLTLAFVGEQEVHRNNARALLDDFVDGWQKQHRRGEVDVILPDWDDPTDTMADIDDWASTSGYNVNHTGVRNLIAEYLLNASDARLILVGDPNDSDMLYDVTEEAAKYRIQTRSLINGLEKVVFDDDDFEDDLAGQDGFHEVDVESGEGWAVDDKDELSDEAAALLSAVDDVPDAPADDAPPDLDLLAALADDGEIDAQQEINSIAAALELDVTSADTWVEAVVTIRGKTGEVPTTTVVSEEFYDSLDEVAEEAVVVIADGPVELTWSDLDDLVEEVASREEVEEAAATNNAVYTRAELEAKSFDEVKAIALDHGIPPGRGMKHKVFVNKILQATGVETEPPKQKRTRRKLEAVEPAAGEATEAKDSDNTHGSNVIPISEVVQGHSLKEIADSLRHYADVLDPPLEV